MTRKLLTLLAMLMLILGGSAAAQGQRMKIIFDTDLGGDIDDAFAHALIQCSPEFEVLGITVGDGPTAARGRVACRMLWEAGQEGIPVAVGRPTRPNDGVPPQLHWGDGFERVKPVEKPAAEFIIETLRRYPHQVTIISVGPVTNLGDVIDQDPAAWKLVKQVYAMFGSFYMGYDQGPRPSAEWNVVADVPAAQKFMTSGAPITLAGLDVTTMVKFDEQRRLQLQQRNSPLTDAIGGLYTLWSIDRFGRHPTLFDPVAVAMALTGEELVRTRAAHVRVSEEGFTVVDESQAPNCRIGMNIATERFLDWLTRRLLIQNLRRWD